MVNLKDEVEKMLLCRKPLNTTKRKRKTEITLEFPETIVKKKNETALKYNTTKHEFFFLMRTLGIGTRFHFNNDFEPSQPASNP